jgi:hypothetical protein
MIFKGRIVQAIIGDNLEEFKAALAGDDIQSINCQNVWGKTLFHFIAEYKSYEFIKYALQIGGDVSVVDEHGSGVLTYLLGNGITTEPLLICDILIDADAEIIIGSKPISNWLSGMYKTRPIITKHLIDRGVIKFNKEFTQTWVASVVNHRQICRTVAILIMGLKRRRLCVFGSNGKDVCTLIMKHTWSMRFEPRNIHNKK